MLGDMGLARKIRTKRYKSKYIPRFNRLYAAPELQNDSTARYTTQCDVYCFGIALWEMVLLRKWTEVELRNGAGACLLELHEVHPIFAKIVSRCWHEEPQLRPTFDELLEEFSRLNHQEWTSYRISEYSTEPQT